MRILALSGRVMLSLIFIASGMTKLTTYNTDRNLSLTSVVKPKLLCFLDEVKKIPNAADLPVHLFKGHVNDLIFVSGIVEVFGGLLFVLDSALGAFLLMGFLLIVTPIMHNFWEPKCYGQDQVPEMVNFMKNLSIFGGLMAYVFKSKRNRKNKTD